jgi:hypothetical protein
MSHFTLVNRNENGMPAMNGLAFIAFLNEHQARIREDMTCTNENFQHDPTCALLE